MNTLIYISIVCLILCGYYGYTEITKLKNKINDLEKTLILEKKSTKPIQPSISNIGLNTIDNITIPNEKLNIDIYKYNESELTKELARDFANFSYLSDSSTNSNVEQIEDTNIDTDSYIEKDTKTN